MDIKTVQDACTYKDAIGWASCALKCSTVEIIDRPGYLVCQRNPLV